MGTEPTHELGDELSATEADLLDEVTVLVRTGRWHAPRNPYESIAPGDAGDWDRRDLDDGGTASGVRSRPPKGPLAGSAVREEPRAEGESGNG